MIVIHVIGTPSSGRGKLVTELNNLKYGWLKAVNLERFQDSRLETEDANFHNLSQTEVEVAQKSGVTVLIFVGLFQKAGSISPQQNYLDKEYDYKFSLKVSTLEFIRYYYNHQLIQLKRVSQEDIVPQIFSSKELLAILARDSSTFSLMGYVPKTSQEIVEVIRQIGKEVNPQSNAEESTEYKPSCLGCGKLTNSTCNHCSRLPLCSSEICQEAVTPVHWKWCLQNVDSSQAVLKWPRKPWSLVIVGDRHTQDQFQKLLLVPLEAGIYSVDLLFFKPENTKEAVEKLNIKVSIKVPVPLGKPKVIKFPIPDKYRTKAFWRCGWQLDLADKRLNESSKPFLVEKSGLTSGPFSIFFWSCHQPFLDAPKLAVRDNVDATLQAYADTVLSETKNSVLVVGLGDAIYIDANKVPNNLLRFLNTHIPYWKEQPVENEAWMDTLVSIIREIYLYHWSFEPMRKVFASVPHLFTWDDHETRDGVGSEKKVDKHEKALREACHRVAHEFLFKVTESGHQSPFTSTTEFFRDRQVGPIAMWLFDSRTARDYSKHVLISPSQLIAFEEFLNSSSVANSELLVLGISVPIIYIRHDIQERLANMPDFAQQITGARDDMRDSWRSPGGIEQLKQILNLVQNSLTKNPRLNVAIVSGDIHLGNAFSFRPPGFPKDIFQFTSSGFTNPHTLPAFLSKFIVIEAKSNDPVLGPIDRIWFDVPRYNYLELETTQTEFRFVLHFSSNQVLTHSIPRVI